MNDFAITHNMMRLHKEGWSEGRITLHDYKPIHPPKEGGDSW